jgi:hypothetical protein
MALISEFFQVFVFYVRELWWVLLLGFLLSGVFNEFISTSQVEKFLGKKGLRPILIASVVGMILPVCCFGSLPIAVTLRRKGALLGPVLAFLVATPATSVSALIVTWKLLGTAFTLYISVAVIVMGLAMGLIGNYLKFPTAKVAPREEEHGDDCGCPPGQEHAKNFTGKIRNILRYALITLPREIGLELLLGVAIASFITVFDPMREAINTYLTGFLGYAAVLAVGLSTYVCSTASVPMANALIESGMSAGPAMTYLLVGPITSYGVLLVLRKEFGGKVLAFYLLVIAVLSLLFGVGFDFLMEKF